jgi:hypothetical protein
MKSCKYSNLLTYNFISFTKRSSVDGKTAFDLEGRRSISNPCEKSDIFQLLLFHAEQYKTHHHDYFLHWQRETKYSTFVTQTIAILMALG